MHTEKSFRIVALVIFVGALVGTLGFGIQSTQLYLQGRDQILMVQDDVHVEIIRTTASDGTPLKAYYFIDPQYENYSNQTIPLLIGCHGMSSTFFTSVDLYYTLIKAGYAVISPEFRGHTSNPAPSTLGYLEPDDIITWLDYSERNLASVNASNSAIFGHSMGASYGFMAYIKESLGQGRLKCCVSGSGPVNLTREIEFLTNDASPLENMSFMDYIDEKNPIDYVNSSFPENVLILHGDSDSVVSFQCSQDIIRVMDPIKLSNQSAGREDIKYVIYEDTDHSLNKSFYQEGFAWIQYYIHGIEIDASSVEILEHPIKRTNGQEPLLYAAISLSVLCIAVIGMIKPQWFMKKGIQGLQERNEVNSTDSEFQIQSFDDTLYPIQKRKTKISLLIGYFVIMTITGWIALLVEDYIASELIIGTIGLLLIGFVILFQIQNEKSRAIIFTKIKEILNLKVGLIVGILIIFGIVLYIYISSIPAIEDATLIAGLRRTWWVAYMTIYLSIQLIINIVLIRLMQPKKEIDFKLRLAEPFLQLLLMGGGIGLFLSPYWNTTYFIIPTWFSFNIDLVVTMSLLFGVAAFVFDIVIQLIEWITKSIVPGTIAMAMIIPMWVGCNTLIFFY